MSESGVIPPPQERNWREVGRMADVDGVPVIFSVNLDSTVRIQIRDIPSRPASITCADLDQDECEEFARLLVSACWEAGRKAATMPP